MQSPVRTTLVVLALGLFAACEDPVGSRTTPLERLPRELTATEREIITASNGFAFGLLREVNRDEAGKNVFISPLSASMALAMTTNGARGGTEQAMRATLGFGQLPLGDMNRSYQALLELLTELDPKVDIRIANAIWYRQGFPLETAFADTTRRYFDASVTGLDFGAPASVRTINDWVDRSTNGKIEKIIDGSIPAEAMLYLMNAIYFKGSWTDRFDPAQTRDADFTLGDGSTARVKMMTRRATYGYATADDFELIDLPYGNGAFSMTVLLPKPGKDVDAVVASLDAQEWSDALSRLARFEMYLSLPRFKLEYQKGLNDALKALGMEIAFSPESDFTGMSPADPWIDTVLQKTFVEVNEQGTEAAAVTSVAVVTSAPPSIEVDRPFVFAIREKFSGTLLFVGKMEKP